MRVLSVFGTRPEAIKMAPVVRELQKHSDRIESRVCVTAQHREMLDQVLGVFGVKPDIDLDLMQAGQMLPELTARVVLSMSEVLTREKPDCVLIQGDTTTVMATALAAFYQQIAVGHVEAGLRTRDLYNPFPEEANRRIADVLAAFYFAPTQTAAEALRREGVAEENIYVTGNTVIDALLWVVRQPEPPEVARLMAEFSGRQLILVTAHRRENFGAAFEEICTGLRELARRNPDVAIVYPVHLNPNVQDPVQRILDGEERIYLLDPLPYGSFAHLMKQAHIILTDSGGIQEEAPALGKPVLVMRRETERSEAVSAGSAKLVGPDAQAIVQEAERLLYDEDTYQRMAHVINPFGDGHAAERIVRVLLERFG